jgi:putative tricarboxylic transport membrane protein
MPITSENKRGRQCLLSMSLSMLSAATGLAIPTIGIDVGTGLQRFSIGITELYGGINFVVIVLGLCCLGEILYSVSNQFAFNSDRTQISNASEARKTTESICRRFCKGAELLLALTLCISFSQASAIIVGTISIYVSQYTDPFSSNIDIPHLGTVYDIALISIVFICVYRVLSKSMLNRFDRKDELTSEMTKSMNPDKDLRNKSMSPVAIYIIFTVMAFVGAYFIHYRLFDMFLLIAFGFAGFLMRRLNFPITPLIVCAALGQHMEGAYRAPFSWTYLTVMFYLLSFVVVAIYIKIAIKPDSNNRGNTSFNYIGDYKRQ